MDHLIVKYLKNELTLQERYQLTKWLEEDENNTEILRNIKCYWEDHKIDLKEKEERVKGSLLQRIEKDQSPKKQSISYLARNAVRIAAIFLLGMTIVFSVYLLNEGKNPKAGITNGFIEKKSAPGEKVTIKLPDGSTVKLNAGSSISYPLAFTGKYREVILKGEGFFEITKNKNKPFIVNVNNAMVKVLGTSFNVNSVKSTNQVVVGVKSGQVKVSNKSENVSRILNPNDLVIFENDGELMKMQKIQDQEMVFGWTDQLLVFNDESVNDIFNTLSNWYGVEFILSRNIDNNRVFTSKFENPTLQSVLESMSYVYDFKYEIKEKTIIIK